MIVFTREINNIFETRHVFHCSISIERSSMVGALHCFRIGMFVTQDHASMCANVRQHMCRFTILNADHRLIQKSSNMVYRCNCRRELVAQTNKLPSSFEALEDFTKLLLISIVFRRKRLRNPDIRIDQVPRHESNVGLHSLESCESIFFQWVGLS